MLTKMAVYFMRCLFVISLTIVLSGCGTLPGRAAPDGKDITMNVMRADDKVWIDGIEGFSNGEYSSSVHGSQARILEYLGEKPSYADLICYSGFAFRINVHEEMCPSGGHPCCGYMCMENSLRSIGWQMKLYDSAPWSEPKADRAAFEAEVCNAVLHSIDRGVPVQYSNEESGLIIGYGDGGKRWWCVHSYYKHGQQAFWYDEVEGFAGGDKWPWNVVVWTEPKDAPEIASDRELTIAALTQAVDMWTEPKQDRYFLGQDAYKHWIGWLEGVEAKTVDDPRGGMLGNGWYFEILIHSRRIGGKWLTEKAELFSPGAAEKLKTAAEHYTRIAELCIDGYEYSWDLAPYPEKFDNWTSEMRRIQISRLQAARNHDIAAVKSITKALEIIGK